MWRGEHGSYAINDGDGDAVDKLINTMGVQAPPVGDYTWSFTVLGANAFTAQATPNTPRQATDGWLQINQNGTKTDSDGRTYPDPLCKWSR
jgi:hypothetical protein